MYCARTFRISLWCFLMSGVVASGCGSSYLVTPSPERGEYSYEQLNVELLKKEAVVVLKNGVEMNATQIRIDADSVSWQEPLNGKVHQISIDDMAQISRTDHLMGALEGLGAGAIVDGLILAKLVSTPQHEFPVAGLLVLLGIPSLFTATGAVIGHRYEYEFP
jgi:hypothetical protein